MCAHLTRVLVCSLAQTARSFFPENKYKQHYLDGIPADAPVSLYRCGPFVDLCRGPHLRHVGQVGVRGALCASGSRHINGLRAGDGRF